MQICNEKNQIGQGDTQHIQHGKKRNTGKLTLATNAMLKVIKRLKKKT